MAKFLDIYITFHIFSLKTSSPQFFIIGRRRPREFRDTCDMTSRLLITAAALSAVALVATGVSADSTVAPESLPTSAALDSTTGLTASEHTLYGWPSGQEVTVLRHFDVGDHNWLPGHRGVDLALVAGDPVYAAGDGVVIFAGKLNDRELVSIEHSDGLRTTYEPIEPTVSKGDVVSRGTIIGYVTGQHCVIGSCLHWGAKIGSDDYIDPLSLVRGPIRLLE